MTSSLSFCRKWGHRRKKASSSAWNTSLRACRIKEMPLRDWEAGTSLGSRQWWNRILLYPEIHFSWHWARTERWGKNNLFLKKNPLNKQREKCLNKAIPPKLSPNLSLQKLSGVCQELMFILIIQTVLMINSPDTIAFLFHICQARCLSEYSCIKLWNMYGLTFHWLCSAPLGKELPPSHCLCPQLVAGAAADGHSLLIPASLKFLSRFLGWG